ncbi:MAG: ATP-dependent Clp protease ATP-binding subunit [Candidatus Riflebacteria bacterium]|nr:ATP-dependent Clp protease ATP-binding subunit [Candidatus Riflebacteria bacterium]
MIEEYGRDLTMLASQGVMDPLIGREEEIKRMVDILSMEGKNNPVLLGPPGVGKTCIVEGFAAVVASGRVPKILQGKRVIQLDIASLLGGTMYRGQLEARVEKIVSELVEGKNVILFIDELHQITKLVQAGCGFDFGNYIKPFLARGDFSMIGATTESEFKKFIEDPDPAFARRFIRIRIDEPKPDELKLLLIRVGKKFGAHYRIVVPEVTIDKTIAMADQYLRDRFFPDKGIDLLKEAIAEKRFKEDGGKRARAGLTALDAVIANEIKAIEAHDCDRISATLTTWDLEKEKFFAATLTVEDVAVVLSRRTGAPVGEGRADEITKRMGALQEAFKTAIIGQKRAKDAIIGAIKMLGAGIRQHNKPIGSFLFLGPSGTGKTETAKTIARAFFGDEKRLIRFDMSEFYDDHLMARFIGSPVGYVGSDEDGLLTKEMTKNPFSVVLFDEIEKAHPKLFDIFLQMLDEGTVKDMKGQTASFKNAIIIITSNVGTHNYAGLEQRDFEAKFPALQAKVLEELKKAVRPEIINRLEHVIPFSPFTRDELMAVFRKLAAESAKHILEQKNIVYTVTDACVAHAVDTGYDSQFGARPMRREVQRIEECIAEAVLDRLISSGDKVDVGVEDKKYILRKVYQGA